MKCTQWSSSLRKISLSTTSLFSNSDQHQTTSSNVAFRQRELRFSPKTSTVSARMPSLAVRTENYFRSFQRTAFVLLVGLLPPMRRFSCQNESAVRKTAIFRVTSAANAAQPRSFLGVCRVTNRALLRKSAIINSVCVSVFCNYPE